MLETGELDEKTVYEDLDKIKHYIKCHINHCGCNLECSYCYLRQGGYEFCDGQSTWKYSWETIQRACKKERLGGACMFEIVGDGETLLPKEIVELVTLLLKEGHFVLLVTNGTVSKRIVEIIEKAKEIGKQDYLHMVFSFHYLELKRKHLLHIFFDNIRYVHNEDISFHITGVIGWGGRLFGRKNCKRYAGY